MVSLGSAPARRRWRLTATALAVVSGVVLGVAMADASAVIMRSCLLCGGVAAIGLRAFQTARGRLDESRESARLPQRGDSQRYSTGKSPR